MHSKYIFCSTALVGLEGTAGGVRVCAGVCRGGKRREREGEEEREGEREWEGERESEGKKEKEGK